METASSRDLHVRSTDCIEDERHRVRAGARIRLPPIDGGAPFDPKLLLRGVGEAPGDHGVDGAPEGRGAQSRWTSHRDRKSTRLNSSHVEISYAVFCLKKNMTAGI